MRPLNAESEVCKEFFSFLLNPKSNFEVNKEDEDKLSQELSKQKKDFLELKTQTYIKVLPTLNEYISANSFAKIEFLNTVWKFYLPFALRLTFLYEGKKDSPLICGILGVQGAGKTTLTLTLTRILNCLGLNVLSFSIDDIYKTHEEREALKARDPRFYMRGPPGTHDVNIAEEIFRKAKAGEKGPFRVPQFEKSLHNGNGDRVGEKIFENVDVILFEGWFVGLRPTDEKRLEEKIPPITSENDVCFAKEINKLLIEYTKLWDYFDEYVALIPEEFEFSKIWRKEAERKMIEKTGSGKTEEEIDAFVDYFWKSLHPKIFIPEILGDEKGPSFAAVISKDHELLDYII